MRSVYYLSRTSWAEHMLRYASYLVTSITTLLLPLYKYHTLHSACPPFPSCPVPLPLAAALPPFPRRSPPPVAPPFPASRSHGPCAGTQSPGQHPDSPQHARDQAEAPHRPREGLQLHPVFTLSTCPGPTAHELLNRTSGDRESGDPWIPWIPCEETKPCHRCEPCCCYAASYQPGTAPPYLS